MGKQLIRLEVFDTDKNLEQVLETYVLFDTSEEYKEYIDRVMKAILEEKGDD